MNYEKKYKEALERAKKLYEQGTITESLSNVFPELRESDDERIRKDIISFLKIADKFWPRLQKDKCIAWVEKQKSISYDELPQSPHKYNQGDWIVSKYGGIYQIKEVLKGSYNLLCESGAEEINSISQVDNSSRLLTMHDIIEKQKSVEWTKEDEENLQNSILTIHAANYYTLEEEGKMLAWLKSIKQRMENKL